MSGESGSSAYGAVEALVQHLLDRHDQERANHTDRIGRARVEVARCTAEVAAHRARPASLEYAEDWLDKAEQEHARWERQPHWRLAREARRALDAASASTEPVLAPCPACGCSLHEHIADATTAWCGCPGHDTPGIGQVPGWAPAASADSGASPTTDRP